MLYPIELGARSRGIVSQLGARSILKTSLGRWTAHQTGASTLPSESALGDEHGAEVLVLVPGRRLR